MAAMCKGSCCKTTNDKKSEPPLRGFARERGEILLQLEMEGAVNAYSSRVAHETLGFDTVGFRTGKLPVSYW